MPRTKASWVTDDMIPDRGIPGYQHWTDEACEIRDRIYEKNLRDELVNLGLRTHAKCRKEVSNVEVDELRQEFARQLGTELKFRTPLSHFHIQPDRVRQLLKSLDLIELIYELLDQINDE